MHEQEPVQEVAAYSTFAMTVGLVLARPRLGLLRIGPLAAVAVGVAFLLALGTIHPADLSAAAGTLWAPLITVAAIMVITAAAQRVGTLDVLAARLERRAAGRSAAHIFASVFVLSALTSAVLNNDAAVLLLTPLVISLVRRRWPGQPRLLIPFAFAVFMAAGVAPLAMSNPMNMIVASYAHLGFNSYALTMLPISVIGWLVTFVALRLYFHRTLTAAGPAATTTRPAKQRPGARALLLVVAITVLAYPIITLLEGPVWPVAVAGAILAVALAARSTNTRASALIASGVSWEILGFLVGVFLLAIGLRNAGVVSRLTEIYANATPLFIGCTSALGSAVTNNHPMAILNVLALDGHPRADLLAALVGGDLGPRLLPMGSLAGLLWMESLRRLNVPVSLATFIRVGAAVTIPALLAALLLL